MSLADDQYLDIVDEIIGRGSLVENRTGIDAYKLPHQIMQFDLSAEFPILQSKFVAFKTAVKEMLWIWQLQSNDVRVLQDMGVKVWNEWMREDGTIGKAYGYQLAKLYKYDDVDELKAKELFPNKDIKKEVDYVLLNQVDKLLYDLTYNKTNRRMIVSLWNIEDLHDMALQPCAYETLWDVDGEYLNCMLIQRSADMGLGCPFNMTQYAVLINLIAQCVGLKPGLFTYVINNAHVYENHKYPILDQIERYYDNKPMPRFELKINPNKKNFYDFTIDDFELVNYTHLGKINMEVAV